MLLFICLGGVSDGHEHILYLYIIGGEISEEAVQSITDAQYKISLKRRPELYSRGPSKTA